MREWFFEWRRCSFSFFLSLFLPLSLLFLLAKEKKERKGDGTRKVMMGKKYCEEKRKERERRRKERKKKRKKENEWNSGHELKEKIHWLSIEYQIILSFVHSLTLSLSFLPFFLRARKKERERERGRERESLNSCHTRVATRCISFFYLFHPDGFTFLFFFLLPSLYFVSLLCSLFFLLSISSLFFVLSSSFSLFLQET